MKMIALSIIMYKERKVKPLKLAAGIMSGTSLDGIDVAIAKITGIDENTEINFIDGVMVPWPLDVANKIKDAMDIEKSNVALISELNFEISHCYFEAVKKACEKVNVKLSDLDFIAIHGQTIWHDPYGKTPSTLQIGDGSVLSELTNTTVVSNFRTADIAAKGQGAPLVPFFDKIMFGKKEGNISVHNLGGISNLSLFVNHELKVAFDTGPANMMIDYIMQNLFNKPYDEDGNNARKGEVIIKLYDEVMSLNYFKVKPPKSTGRELFGNHYMLELLNKYQGYDKHDYLHTFTKITIDSIVNSYLELNKKYGNIDEIIFSGGGAHNKYILEQIANQLKNTKISKSSDYNISIDYKEALAFIVLGNQTLNNKPSNLIEATGAKAPAILGQISYRRKG